MQLHQPLILIELLVNKLTSALSVQIQAQCQLCVPPAIHSHPELASAADYKMLEALALRHGPVSRSRPGGGAVEIYEIYKITVDGKPIVS